MYTERQVDSQQIHKTATATAARLFSLHPLLLCMRRPQLEGEVVRGRGNVLAVRRHVRVDDATRVALQRSNGGPLGVAPQLGRLVEGARQDVVVAFSWRVGRGEKTTVLQYAR